MNFIINLIIFLLSLTGLVLIHELGHFAMAKLFKVYCREFSIGMGPLIFKHKRKGGETQFSIRAIPIGGFVSMVGEDANDNAAMGGQKDPLDKTQTDITAADLTEEEKFIMSLPKERRLDGIAKWKRAIIMAAGVIMNMILAFFLFLGMNLNVHVIDNKYRSFNEVVLDSNAEKAGITTEDVFKAGQISYRITIKDTLGQVDENKYTYTIKEDTLDEVYFTTGTDLYNFFSTTYVTLDDDNQSINLSDGDYINYKLTTDEDVIKNIKLYASANTSTDDDGNTIIDSYSFPKIGIGFHTRKYNPGEVIKYTFSDIGDSSVAIIKALGTLFTKEGIEQVGGPIAIFQLSAEYSSLGFEYYCMLWGLISVNLAVMNFLPFPGLDGWHFLVLIVEGITRKEMPKKAKNIASMIGLGLLFILMILITLKDIINLF